MNEDTKPRLAVDLDSTLAATADTAFDIICGPVHRYSYSDMESYDWPLNEFGSDEFIGGVHGAWSARWDRIEPMEPNIKEKMEWLNQFFVIDIVTVTYAGREVKNGKKNWLDKHDIDYHSIKFAESTNEKARSLNYRYYVDDHPDLPTLVDDSGQKNNHVFLLDRPYNRDAATESRYDRIHSIVDAATACPEVDVQGNEYQPTEVNKNP